MTLVPSALISRHASNRSPSRSSTNPRSHRKLYFPPGSRTHDRHTIPPDRLHVSFFDPVLVAAEERLVSNQRELSVARESRAIKTDNPGSVVSHLSKGGGEIFSPRSGDGDDSPLVVEAVSPTITTCTQETRLGRFWKAGFRGTAAQGPGLLDMSRDSCDIAEVVTIVINVSSDDGNNSTIENSRCGPGLAPLASEAFKEELYIRGYLNRPANVVPQRSRPSFTSVSRMVFQKVLGRRQGRKIAETLRARQDTGEILDGSDAHLSEQHLSTVASVTLRAPHADDLESPGMDTNASASESFDLHEFSYITAFTTPPSSPSIILDAETFRKGVCLGDSEHAV